MLLSSNTLFHLPIKTSIERYFDKKNMLFSSGYPKLNALRRKNEKGYSSFTSCCHPPLTVEPTTATLADSQNENGGIEILEFFHGKNIFITGGTGLLGKVVVEKLLRSTTVGKVYVLVKANTKEAAYDRLKTEIISSDLLTPLKEKYGKFFDAFIMEKLIPIAGDICMPNMGMDEESIDAIRKDVNVIIHSAAYTSFDERYDLMINANVIAPQRLVRFAKTCNELHLYTHISTAFVSGKREGIMLEEPMIMGESRTSSVQFDVADEISLLLTSFPKSDENATNFYKKLGEQRADILGFNNTYQLSKAMGEMVVNETRGDVPILIIRPAIIESCYREPIPGWIQGIRTFEPFAISYGKGLLPGIFADPQVNIDLIPVDLVANTMIAAMAKHGRTQTQMPQLNVYHIASALSNSITCFEAFGYLYEYFKEKPLVGGANIAKLKFFDDFDEFSKFIREQIFRNHGAGEDRNQIRQCNAKVEYALRLSKIYEFAAFFRARFDTSNTKKLIEEMSREEQVEFEVDVKNIDWRKYIQEIHFPGIEKYLLSTD